MLIVPFNFDGSTYHIGCAALTHLLRTLWAPGLKGVPEKLSQQVLQDRQLCHLDISNQENQFCLNFL